MKTLLPIATFILGLVVAETFGALVFPIRAPLERMATDIFCSIDWFCKSHREFKANSYVQCQDGEIGALVRQAVRDGDLRDAKSGRQVFAERAYLCADDPVEFRSNEAMSHLQQLADQYKECFEIRENEFWLRTGRNTNICMSKRNKKNGLWTTVESYLEGRIFCFPEPRGDSANGTQSAISAQKEYWFIREIDDELPICAQNQLQGVGAN